MAEALEILCLGAESIVSRRPGVRNPHVGRRQLPLSLGRRTEAGRGGLPVFAAGVGVSVSPRQSGGHVGSKRRFCCFSSCLLRREGPEPLPAALGEGSLLSAAASFGSRPSPFTQRAAGGTLARAAHPFPSAGAHETLNGGESGGRARFPRSGVLARPSSLPAAGKRWSGWPSTVPPPWERMGYRLNEDPSLIHGLLGLTIISTTPATLRPSGMRTTVGCSSEGRP